MDKRKEANQIVRESICDALVGLMKIKSFEKITVTEIIAKAGVAGASYYRNFESKEQVAREYILRHIQIFMQEADKPLFIDSYENILHVFQTFYRCRETLHCYAEAGLGMLLLETLSTRSVYRTDSEEKLRFSDDYFAAFIGALSFVALEWFRSGFTRSPEQMARAFHQLWHKKSESPV